MKKEKVTEVKAPTQTPNIEGVMSIKEVKKLLTSSETYTNKMLKLVESAPTHIKHLASSLMEFNKDMAVGGVVMTDRAVAARHAGLHGIIINTLTHADEEMYRVGFDVINLTFLNCGKNNGAFSEVRLHRYDHLWSSGSVNLKNYQILVTLISMLADLTTRAKNLKGLQLGNLEQTLPSIARDRLHKYYS